MQVLMHLFSESANVLICKLIAIRDQALKKCLLEATSAGGLSGRESAMRTPPCQSREGSPSTLAAGTQHQLSQLPRI